jgi:ribonucleoside-diphosphate reductase beta chain
MSTIDISYINYFNDYTEVRKSLFLDGKVGLIENLRNEFPDIWEKYKLLKSLDWDEKEIDISSCRNEFKNTDKEICDLMIRTLAWQFEADSSAAHVGTLMAPFVNNTELLAYLYELMKNETLHSLAYKTIVEYSFENPEEFLKELLSIEESFKRLDTVKRIFDETYVLSHSYALGLETNEHKIRIQIFKFWVTLLALERIQFISSFVITFGLAEQGYFVPIAKLVQKISTDEFQVHVQTDKLIIQNELNVEENFTAYLDALDDINKILKEVIDSELKWLEFLYAGKDEIAKIRKNKVRDFIIYSATEVYRFLSIENPYGDIVDNPLPYMNKWLIIDSNQSSPQEESVANYLLGGFIDDSTSIDTIKYGLSFGV